ncbi:GNAT family N-acetyltransferase [Flammeovirga agarivorans]|uniref:GNAT family N-acetyltransferase n=1 Tax=Flammeovirga agarivorans TaxID=2726742 RepID=A0A7X8SJN6_9BACT|nr:GNAT family N-acetyltransferase [Flammeovirga agarivorans]NLR91483.1 GNAT family N-acetyltransferase [Flammeovirga agarivorans]
MNHLIIQNLFDLWEHIGEITNTLTKTDQYSSVFMQQSDWPKRVFRIIDKKEVLLDVIEKTKSNELPEGLTIQSPNSLENNDSFQYIMSQKNMAIDTKEVKPMGENNFIKQVTTKEDAYSFAATASQSFGYTVDGKVVNAILQHSSNVRLFIFQEESTTLGCGMVYFDPRGIAGLHMIGTIPEGRGKGVGKSITERLLKEAKAQEAEHCVLHASKMGEPIYSKLGFKTFGEIETYRIIKE